MENSSSSKTRSPARVLAAFLAAVMLFIVMPVLPVGAAGTVNDITFLNVSTCIEEGDGDNIIFNPNGDEIVNKVKDGTEDTPFKWGSLSNLTALEIKNADDYGRRDIKIISKDGFQNSYTGSKAFKFALFSSQPRVNVYYATDDTGPWTLVTPNKQATESGCNVYTIPQGSMSGSIFIKIAEPRTVTFTIDEGITVKAGLTKDQINTPVNNAETFDVLIDANSQKDEGTLFFSAEMDSNLKNEYDLKIGLPTGLEAKAAGVPNGYEVDKITKGAQNINVSIKLVKKSYDVKMTFDDFAEEKYTVNVDSGTTKVSHGDPYAFTVTTIAGYSAPKVTINSSDSYKGLKKSENGMATTYTILSVTEPLDIQIKAGDAQTYTLTFPKSAENGFSIGFGDDYSEQMPKTAEHNQKIKFQLKRLPGWSGEPMVTANGRAVAPTHEEEGLWQYEYAVVDNTTFSIVGLSQETYRVSILPQQGVFNLLESVATAHYGDTVTFTMTLLTGWELDKELNEYKFVLKNNGTDIETLQGANSEHYSVKVEPVVGSASTYTITIGKIAGPLSLTAEGFAKTKLNVKVECNDLNHVTVKRGEAAYTDAVQVEYGEGVNFTITPHDGYRIENVSVCITGKDAALANVMVDNKDGTYSIGNVVDNYTIKVRVVAVKFTITIQSTSTTTLGKGEGKTTLMGSASVTKTYTIANDGDDDAQVIYKDGYYELTLPTATRPGWKLVGWKYTSGLSVSGNTLTFTGNADQSQTVIAEWKINTDLNEDGANPFIALNIKRDFKDGKDVITVTHVENNIDQSDIGGTVKLLSHGILYGITENALSGFSGMVEAGSITYADFANGNSSGSLSKFGKLTDVYFSWHDDSGKDTGNMLEDTHNFTEKVGNAKQAEGCAIGYMVVQIGNQTYLFCTRVESWEKNN